MIDGVRPRERAQAVQRADEILAAGAGGRAGVDRGEAGVTLGGSHRGRFAMR